MINNEELKKIFTEVKNDNTDAFNILYEKTNKLVYGISFSICKNNADSEDIVQNVFSKIYALDKTKLPQDNESSWIYRVTKNETIDYLRRKKPTINMDDLYDIGEENSDINDIISKETYEKLISGLSQKEKEIMSLKILSDLSFDEIGKMVGEPVGTVKWRYYKSITSLKMSVANMILAFIAIFVGIFEKSSTNYTKKDEGDSQTSEKFNSKTGIDFDSALDEEMYDSVQNTTSEAIGYLAQNIEISQICMGFAGIFFVISIICTIFFKKHQLKRKNNTSK